MELRPYQTAAVEGIRDAMRRGAKNVLLCAPTGAGKTLIASHIIDEARRKGSRALFVCDQINLINQTSSVFDSHGIPHGIIQGKNERYRPWERVQVASAQTLARRNWPECDLIVVDECHTLYRNTSRVLRARRCVSIGLTATPFTSGLGSIYDAFVNVATTDFLIGKKFLSGFFIYAPQDMDMAGVKVLTTGEWDTAETSERAQKIVGDVVHEYRKHAAGKKFICSAVDIKHARALSEEFKRAGIFTEVYTSDVREEERAEIVEEFRKPDSVIRGLVTVVAATKGFDVPDVGALIIARPLRKSLTQYIQFLGRGLRPHPGKDRCIILDHTGNTERFLGQWTEFFRCGVKGLEDVKKLRSSPRRKEKKINMRKCPKCGMRHNPMPYCPVCGHEYPPPRPVVNVAGRLEEMIHGGERRELTRDIWGEICAYSVFTSKDLEHAKRKALGLFKGITGVWPDRDFISGGNEKIRPEVMNLIVSSMEKYKREMRRKWWVNKNLR